MSCTYLTFEKEEKSWSISIQSKKTHAKIDMSFFYENAKRIKCISSIFHGI